MIWGLVHMLAGVMVMAQTTSQGFAVIADAVDLMLLVAEHHPAVGGVLGQHGAHEQRDGVGRTGNHVSTAAQKTANESRQRSGVQT